MDIYNAQKPTTVINTWIQLPSSVPPQPKLTNGKDLRRLYHDERLSLREIAEKSGCGHRTVKLALIRFGIPTRTRYEGITNYFSKFYQEKMSHLHGLQYSEDERKLLALAIDLEGAIALTKRKQGNRLHAYVAIANTSSPILDYIYRLAKLGSVSPMKKYRGNRKPVGVWAISDFFTLKFFLEQVVSYFVAKKQQAELTIRFCQSRINTPRAPYTGEELEIYDQMKKLNKRGL